MLSNLVGLAIYGLFMRGSDPFCLLAVSIAVGPLPTSLSSDYCLSLSVMLRVMLFTTPDLSET